MLLARACVLGMALLSRLLARLQSGATTTDPTAHPQSITRRHMQALLRCRGFDLAEEHQCLLVDLQDCAIEDLPPGEPRCAALHCAVGAAALPTICVAHSNCPILVANC